jgi:hypothetical protein
VHQVCVASPDMLAVALSPVLNTCEALLSDKEHMQEMAQADNAGSAKEYCESCYWPFLRTVINRGMSDEFWCKHRGIVVRDVGNQTCAIIFFAPVFVNQTLHWAYIFCGIYYENKTVKSTPKLTDGACFHPRDRPKLCGSDVSCVRLFLLILFEEKTSESA